MEMAPGTGSIQSQRSVTSTLSTTSICNPTSPCQVTGRLSLYFLPKLLSIRNLPERENGLDGIRTRICDLDRVPCCRYTTSPSTVCGGINSRRKVSGHTRLFSVPDREGLPKCF